MAEPGRPRVLDAVKQSEVLALISTGYGLPGAARYVGCSANTIRREAKNNPVFGQQLRDAEKEARLRPLKAIRRKAHTHWRAAAWLLERTEPEKYAKKESGLLKPKDVEGLIDAVLERILLELRLDPAFEFVLEKISKKAKEAVLNNPLSVQDKTEMDRLMNRSMQFLAQLESMGNAKR